MAAFTTEFPLVSGQPGYLLLCGSMCYPRGWDDFQGFYWSPERAEEVAKVWLAWANEDTSTSGWYEVVDLQTGLPVAFGGKR